MISTQTNLSFLSSYLLSSVICKLPFQISSRLHLSRESYLTPLFLKSAYERTVLLHAVALMTCLVVLISTQNKLLVGLLHSKRAFLTKVCRLNETWSGEQSHWNSCVKNYAKKILLKGNKGIKRQVDISEYSLCFYPISWHSTENLGKQLRFNINQLMEKPECMTAKDLFCTELAFPGEESQDETGKSLAWYILSTVNLTS